MLRGKEHEKFLQIKTEVFELNSLPTKKGYSDSFSNCDCVFIAILNELGR